MNISKINSIAFNGYIMVKDQSGEKRCFYTKNISYVRKFQDGTQIVGPDTNGKHDCFVRRSGGVTYQDVAAAYNMAQKDPIRVDLTNADQRFWYSKL